MSHCHCLLIAAIGGMPMNVFVLSTGRTGSTTFVEACRHIQNYSVAHQSKSNVLGPERLRFPENHIESDNRLSWFLGRLADLYGDSAFYVHLHRDPRATAKSFLKRYGEGITRAYYPGIVTRNLDYEDSNKNLSNEMKLRVCEDMVETVNANIRTFIEQRPHSITIPLEDPKEHFREFWNRIEAQGDLQQSLAEWDINHNANNPTEGAYRLRKKQSLEINFARLPAKIVRVARKFPRFLIEA